MTRSLIMTALGMAAIIAAVLLFRWGGIAGQPVGPHETMGLLKSLPTVLATVNGRPISRLEVEQELESIRDPAIEDIRAAVRRLIDVQLLADAAARTGATRPSGPSALSEKSLAQQAVVWPEEIAAFWSRNRQTFSEDFFHIRRLARHSEYEVRQAGQALLNGAPVPITLPAAEWLGSGQLEVEVERALAGMKPGELSEPVPTDGWYHVLQLLDRKAAPDVSLVEWTPRLTEYLQAERWFREQTRWLRLREAYAALNVAPELNFPRAADALELFRLHPEVVAVVNDKTITDEQLAVQSAQVRAMAGKAQAGRSMREQELRPVLGRMIQNMLVREEAKKLGLQVPDSELEERFNALRSGFSSDEGLDAMLHANATSRADWWRNMREGLLQLKTEYAYAARLPIDPDEIEAYWKQNRAGLTRDRVKVTRVRFGTEREALEQLRSGAAFDSLVRTTQSDQPAAADAAQWYTHEMLPHEVWAAAWAAVLRTVVGPILTSDGYWLLRVEERQEAKAQTIADHRDHIKGILQHTHWADRERARWLLDLMGRATISTRFDMTLKLNQRAPATPGLRLGGRPTLVVLTLERGCGVGRCEWAEEGWTGSIPLQIISPAHAERAVRLWGLPTVPWTFAIDARGVVVGECPGPVTKPVLERLASLLDHTPERMSGSAQRPARDAHAGEIAYAR